MRATKQGRNQGLTTGEAGVWGPPVMQAPLPKIVTKRPKITHFLIDFYIIETLYIPVTIVNSDHAAEASMLWKIKHSATY